MKAAASTCVLGGQQARHLIHAGEALLLCQRQLSSRREAAFLQHNHLHHCRHTITTAATLNTAFRALNAQSGIHLSVQSPDMSHRLLEGFRALRRTVDRCESKMTQGRRGGWKGACLGASFRKQSSRNATSCARSADHGIRRHHNSVALQLDALHACMATQRLPESLHEACTITLVTCRLPVSMHEATKHYASAVSRSRLPLHQAANDRSDQQCKGSHTAYYIPVGLLECAMATSSMACCCRQSCAATVQDLSQQVRLGCLPGRRTPSPSRS